MTNCTAVAVMIVEGGVTRELRRRVLRPHLVQCAHPSLSFYRRLGAWRPDTRFRRERDAADSHATFSVPGTTYPM